MAHARDSSCGRAIGFHFKDGLPPAAEDFFHHFLRHANATSLKTCDWEHFYTFVVVCHEARAEYRREALHRALIDAGFREQQATLLANAYGRGRDLLSAMYL
jgi:hypothetical protein